MSTGFTKLFSDIITSSIWSEDDKTRLMWITLLASADPTGYVSGSVPGMAAIARMTLQDAEKSIAALCAPDQYSRSKEYDGRRIVETEGGWLILNYLKYRQKRDPERRREQNRLAQQRWREKHCVSKNKPKSAKISPRQKTEDRRQNKPPIVPLKKGESAPAAKSFREYWNAKLNLPRIQRMTTDRGKKLAARMKEPDFRDNWRQIIDRIAASSFCTGGGQKGWKVDVDWLLGNSTSYVKVLEGKYDDSVPTAVAPVERGPDGLTPRERELKRIGAA